MSHRKRNNKGFNKVQESNVVHQNDNDSKTTKQLITLKPLIVWVTIILITSFVYINSLGNAFVSDDIGGIVQNPNLNNFSYLFSSPLRALRFLQPTIYFMINQIFGLSATAFRLTNIVIHLGTVSLVFFVVLKLRRLSTASIAALLTGVHPIMSESVTWISGGGHSLYTMFAWSTFCFVVLSREKRVYVIPAIITCFMAITVSEKAVILPFVVLMFMWVYQIRKIKISEVALFVIPAIVIGIVFISKLAERLSWLQSSYYQTGERASIFTQIPIAIGSYLSLIVWPDKLTLYHSELSFTPIQFAILVVVFTVFIALIIYSFRKHRQICFWLCYFIIGLAPTLTPFGISWIVAERYVYFSAIGIYVAVALVLTKLINKKEVLGWSVVTLVIIALSIRTIVRNMDWRNQDTLWIATARTSPSSPQNHNNLGDLYGRQGNFDKSIEEFKKAIDINPNYADAIHNLANTYMQVGKLDLAKENFAKAISINPNIWQSYANLAAIYFNENKFTDAIANLNKAVLISPTNSELYAKLGVVYLKTGDKEAARTNFTKALQLNPEDKYATQGLKEITSP